MNRKQTKVAVMGVLLLAMALLAILLQSQQVHEAEHEIAREIQSIPANEPASQKRRHVASSTPEQARRSQPPAKQNLSGYFFFNGKYIDAPYKVAIDGKKVTINGHVVFDGSSYQQGAATIAKPKIPDNLTAKSTFFDLARKDKRSTLDIDMAIWIRTQYPPQEASKRILEFYKSFPFVISARWDDKDPTVLIIQTNYQDQPRYVMTTNRVRKSRLFNVIWRP